MVLSFVVPFVYLSLLLLLLLWKSNIAGESVDLRDFILFQTVFYNNYKINVFDCLQLLFFSYFLQSKKLLKGFKFTFFFFFFENIICDSCIYYM
jgi:hypothetical protein